MKFRLFIYALCIAVIALWGLNLYQEHNRLLKAQEHFFSYEDRPINCDRYSEPLGLHFYPTHTTGIISSGTTLWNTLALPESSFAMTQASSDDLTDDEGTITYTTPSFETGKEFTLAITDDGELQINGKAVKELSHPELKAILREMADSMKKQAENNELLKHCDRQTQYLLDELFKCRNGK